MTDRPRLCLNMIVRDEVPNLVTSLPSLAPWIACYCIIDTGSTDATVAFITSFFDNLKIPGMVLKEPFENFEQARNIALDHARSHMRGSYDYLILCDADMDLVVDDQHCLDDLTAPVYLVMQKAGILSYYNARLLRHDVPARYVGVTHEYLDFGHGEQRLEGAWFSDRGTGAHHDEKNIRDIALLEQGLAADPENVRYMFYLAQSYSEANRPEDAVRLFERRARGGGWEEEVFMSLLRAGKEYKKMAQEANFIRSMLAAYNARPIRAEPLFELAHYYRERENNNVAAMIAEVGMGIKRPNDLLFIDETVYQYGVREEFSITGFYNPDTRPRAFAVCNDLALDRSIPEGNRALARQNLFHYLEPIGKYCRSWTTHRISNPPVPGYTAMNPSVCLHDDWVWVNVRLVNYRITDSGHYDMQGDTAIRTQNILMPLDRDRITDFKPDDPIPHPDNLGRFAAWPVAGHLLRWQRPQAAYDQVIGLEDLRIFSHGGELWGNACVRELNPEGWCEQVLVRIDPGTGEVVQWNAMLPEQRTTEKNWAAVIDHPSGEIMFMYHPGTVIDQHGNFDQVHEPARAIDHFSGSSQLIPFNGGWLAVVHEVQTPAGYASRVYQHRFVWYGHDLVPALVSRPFLFQDRQIEYCAGLCRHPGNGALVLSYGVRDREAWIGLVDWHDVWEMLHG